MKRRAGCEEETRCSLSDRELRAVLQEVRRMTAQRNILHKSFNDMTVELMAERKMTIQPLSDATGISRETIKYMRNDPSRVFGIREIVAVCIALHLDPAVSELYLESSPAKLLDTEEDNCYRYALAHWYGESVPEVNRRLKALGVKPLTAQMEEILIPGKK